MRIYTLWYICTYVICKCAHVYMYYAKCKYIYIHVQCEYIGINIYVQMYKYNVYLQLNKRSVSAVRTI